jgi:hypothetical protein
MVVTLSWFKKLLMKRKAQIIWILLGIVYFTSCKETKPPVLVEPSFSLVFNHVVDGNKLDLNDTTYSYTNAAGNKFNVSEFKYYISNVKLVKEDGSKISLGGFFLIDERKEESKSRVFKNVPEGIYNKIEFYVGLDSVYNHTGDQAGDLDPSYGMIWTWATGYRFMVLEGKYRDLNNTPQGFVFHIATDTNLVKNSIDVTAFEIKQNNKTAYIDCNVNEIFKGPRIWNLNTDGAYMESFPNQISQSVIISTNMGDMFTVKKVE